MATPIATARPPVTLRDAATREAADALEALGSGERGLDPHEAARRLEAYGPNALRSHGTSAWRVLGSQLKNPLLPLLVIAATVSRAGRAVRSS